MPSGIITVFRKELLEVVRDRKTLFFMVVLPLVVMPLLSHITTTIVSDAMKEADSVTLDYALFDEQHLPELAPAFASQPGFAKVELGERAEISDAVADDRIDFAMVVVPPATEGGPRQVELHYNKASQTSKVEPRVRAVVDALNGDLRRGMLDEAGVVEIPQQQAIAEPVALLPKSTASLRETLGEVIGGFLPYIFILLGFFGAMFPAIDLAAGEKERGTLETLLLAPLARRDIVLGKFLVTFTSSVMAALLTLVGFGGWIVLKGSDVRGVAGEIISSIGVLDATMVALMLVPTAAIFAALLLAISIYAKSFKEAQSYMTPLQLLIILPAMAGFLPGVELNWTTASIPITNISLAIKELIKGTMDYSMMVAILGSTTVLAGILLWASTWWFSRESVLFRQ